MLTNRAVAEHKSVMLLSSGLVYAYLMDERKQYNIVTCT